MSQSNQNSSASRDSLMRDTSARAHGVDSSKSRKTLPQSESSPEKLSGRSYRSILAVKRSEEAAARRRHERERGALELFVPGFNNPNSQQMTLPDLHANYEVAAAIGAGPSEKASTSSKDNVKKDPMKKSTKAGGKDPKSHGNQKKTVMPASSALKVLLSRRDQTMPGSVEICPASPPSPQQQSQQPDYYHYQDRKDTKPARKKERTVKNAAHVTKSKQASRPSKESADARHRSFPMHPGTAESKEGGAAAAQGLAHPISSIHTTNWESDHIQPGTGSLLLPHGTLDWRKVSGNEHQAKKLAANEGNTQGTTNVTRQLSAYFPPFHPQYAHAHRPLPPPYGPYPYPMDPYSVLNFSRYAHLHAAKPDEALVAVVADTQGKPDAAGAKGSLTQPVHIGQTHRKSTKTERSSKQASLPHPKVKGASNKEAHATTGPTKKPPPPTPPALDSLPNSKRKISGTQQETNKQQQLTTDEKRTKKAKTRTEKAKQTIHGPSGQTPAAPKKRGGDATEEDIRQALPYDASAVLQIHGRKLNMNSLARDNDSPLYPIFRAWVQDDPFRMLPRPEANIEFVRHTTQAGKSAGFSHPLASTSFGATGAGATPYREMPFSSGDNEFAAHAMTLPEKAELDMSTLRNELINRSKKVRRHKSEAIHRKLRKGLESLRLKGIRLS